MSNNARLYQEWLDKGAHDIEVAQFLFENDHYTDIITLHIQQALEKYIKAFLIKNGWSLKRTHDLVTLAAEAHKFGLNLTQYEDVLDEINEYYIESRCCSLNILRSCLLLHRLQDLPEIPLVHGLQIQVVADNEVFRVRPGVEAEFIKNPAGMDNLELQRQARSIDCH